MNFKAGILKKAYDFNDILRMLNILACSFSAISYIVIGKTKYVDSLTIGILLLFCIVMEYILNKEKESADPFILLLAANIIVFYFFRVLTLIYCPWSTVLPRFAIGSEAINYSLFYILLSVCAIYIGLKVYNVPKQIDYKTIVFNRPPILPMLILFCISNLFYIMRTHFVLTGMIDRFFQYSTIVLNLDMFLLYILIYLCIYWKEITKKECYIVIVSIFLFIYVRVLYNSRAALLNVGVLLLFAALPVIPRIKIKMKSIITIVACFLVSCILFTYSTYMRDYREKETSNYGYFLYLTKDSKRDSKIDAQNPHLLERALDRVGFLDMATDFIANSERYRELVNFK